MTLACNNPSFSIMTLSAYFEQADCNCLAQAVFMPSPGFYKVVRKHKPSLVGGWPRVVGFVYMVGLGLVLLWAVFRRKPA